jgi:hypothetical protein
LPFFHIVHIISHFNLPFFHIFNIVSRIIFVRIPRIWRQWSDQY